MQRRDLGVIQRCLRAGQLCTGGADTLVIGWTDQVTMHQNAIDDFLGHLQWFRLSWSTAVTNEHHPSDHAANG